MTTPQPLLPLQKPHKGEVSAAAVEPSQHNQYKLIYNNVSVLPGQGPHLWR